MSLDEEAAETDPARTEHLNEAIRMLQAALRLVDEHARSPAPALIDLAIHQLTCEVEGR